MRKIFSGWIKLLVISADGASLLNVLHGADIFLKDVTYISALEMQITIHRRNYRKLLEICEKQGASCEILRKNGTYWLIDSVLHRPILVAFVCALSLLFCWLPSRIFFISVAGNTSISTNQILAAAENCGIVFGASRRQVRSEKVKNALLQEIPQLQWAGINTSGCTAVISVREKTTQDMAVKKKNLVSSIVASRDGVIQNCTVLNGNALCAVGQAVKAGQMLVSGYLDCGIVTKTTQADAEIEALTFRELEMLSPNPALVRSNKLSESKRYSLKIGKKLINLYKDSGNLDVSCAKIYEENFLQLPGGFRLPIALIRQTVISYDVIQEIPSVEDSCDWLADFAKTHLRNAMIAGKIVSENVQLNKLDGGHHLYGRYACMEIIGQVKYEQSIAKDEGS